jgi:hypothetical protein
LKGAVSRIARKAAEGKKLSGREASCADDEEAGGLQGATSIRASTT